MGVDIEILKELLGHHSITITQRYIHSNDERKRAAVELLSKKVEDKICDVSVTQENLSKLIVRRRIIRTHALISKATV